MNDIKIYMITHKQVSFIPNGITPLYVGNGKNEENYIRDNLGDNIANKNKNYCELTGLYWMWKNDTSNIVGLCHYRRFFGKNKKDIFNESDKRIKKILNEYDMIVSTKWLSIKTVYEIYKNKHYSSDLDEIKKIISEKYKDYLDSFKTIMNGHYGYACNMFICKKELLNDYCKWLFDILFDLEKNINLNDRDDYQKRVFGFLAERLLAVWILKNGLKVYEETLFFTEETKFNKLKNFIRRGYIKFILKIRGML